MKKIGLPLVPVVQFCFVLMVFSACNDDTAEEIEEILTEFGTGLFDTDDLTSVPSSTTFGFSSSNDLPASYDIQGKFPPIGDQGQYGTCVAWAVGYNTMTALNGINKGLSGSQLSDPNYQFSAKDLFTAIPDQYKGPDCNGTNFSFALDVLQTRGIATEASVPYSDLEGCVEGGTDEFSTEASQNKIKYWRQLEGSINSVKQSIANNIPVIFGARLDDNFMAWNSSEVYDSYSTFDNVGQHAYHAMVIVGYDDAQGANGALRVLNSWSGNWGDVGLIWVDYNFFISDFIMKEGSDYSLFYRCNGRRR